MTDTYRRVQASYRGRLGVEVGLFVAVDHLRRAGRLTAEQEALYLDIDDWFQENLPNPGFYADGNTVGAVTWFKTPLPAEMQIRVDQLCTILASHDVAFELVESDSPGAVIYEDRYQVGVVPAERGEPTPMPAGLALAPTSAGSKRQVAQSSVRHVLFDADGVLQEIPGGWVAAMEPYLGGRAEEFLRRTWKDELPALAGQDDYMPVLAATLAEYGVGVPVEVVYRDVWHRIVVSEESLAIVDGLRRNGYGVHLGTNQEEYRGGHMRTALGYDDLFDVSCYSYDLGVAKPDPGFFTEAARRIAAEPAAILFVDDNAANVAAARSAGLAAEQWELARGHDTLVALLTKHGVGV